MKTPVFRELPIKAIKTAAHNPPGRVQHIKPLVESIGRIGLKYPILVDPSNRIIDGHRRFAAVKKLGLPTILVSVVEDDPNEVYASVNVTAKKMGGNDALGVWLENPAAVTPKQAAIFEAMETDLGRPLVRKVFRQGLSARVWRTAKQIARYCDDTTPETIQAVVKWLLGFAVIGQVMKAMESGESPALIMKAVRAMKPIKFKLAIAG